MSTDATTEAVHRIHEKQHKLVHGDLYKKWIAEASGKQELSSWLRQYDPGPTGNVSYDRIAQHISDLHWSGLAAMIDEDNQI